MRKPEIYYCGKINIIEGIRRVIMIQTMEIVNNQMQVILAGNVFVEEAKKIRGVLNELIIKGQKSILIDLTQVEYIECVGMGMLVSVQKKALQIGGGIKVKGIQRLLKKQFELNYMMKAFEIQ
jgi:anti-sigma B factor antagonist